VDIDAPLVLAKYIYREREKYPCALVEHVTLIQSFNLMICHTFIFIDEMILNLK